MRTHRTLAGNMKVVTLNAFIKELSITESPNPTWWYYAQTRPFSIYQMFKGDFFQTPYDDRYLDLVKPTPKYYRDRLMSDSSRNLIELSENRCLNQHIYDIVTYFQYKGGEPTHLVRLNRRTWMVTNPKYFYLVNYCELKGLASRKPYLNTRYYVVLR
jgi:hypothetical protein